MTGVLRPTRRDPPAFFSVAPPESWLALLPEVPTEAAVRSFAERRALWESVQSNRVMAPPQGIVAPLPANCIDVTIDPSLPEGVIEFRRGREVVTRLRVGDL